MATPRRFRYSPWDGTQQGFDLDAFDVLESMTDDLLYNGDVNSALRRMLQDGLTDRNGERIEGLRDLLERVRQQRAERLASSQVNGMFDELATELRDIVATEHRAIDRAVSDASESGNARRQDLTSADAFDRRMRLDLLPDDLAGQVRSLQDYDFTSAEAAERFEALVDELRSQLLRQTVDQMSDAMGSMGPEELARVKDMLAALNEMLAARARGDDPDFDGFMERFGDFFPENPQTLDELLEVMARRMAAMSALMNSMSPEQRAQLQALSDMLLEDLDLRWQVDQLGSQLRQMFPDAGWSQSYDFEGIDPLDLPGALSAMTDLADLERIESMLAGAVQPGALAEVDIDRVRDLVGPDAARSLERLKDLTDDLRRAGLIDVHEGRLELTPDGLRRLGRNALAQLFRNLSPDLLGGHETERIGVGHERTFTTKAYEWGDPFHLNITRTLTNAVRRRALDGRDGPVELAAEDFEIDQTEQAVRSATVVMLDLSLSMPMRDNFLPAKRVAMALHALISMRYPRDFLGLVGFSQIARVLKPSELPEVSWDFVYGTNMAHGFALARRMLAREHGTKQILMITDGEPTAHLDADGEPRFAYPPVRATVDATLLEVRRCTADGIRINTFMLDADRGLQRFVERMTALNRGRAFFTTPSNLGDFVLVDFLEQRRAVVRDR